MIITLLNNITIEQFLSYIITIKQYSFEPCVRACIGGGGGEDLARRSGEDLARRREQLNNYN